MALMPICTYPDKCLRKRADEVEVFDEKLKILVDDMATTMYAAPGVGLAAVQVNVNKRVVVIDVSSTKDDLHVFINPTILSASGSQEYEEGCLSIPGVYAMVERAAEIKVKAYDLTGKAFEVDANEIFAVCLQHEIDHLNGKLFIDHLSRLKRERIIKKFEKQAKSYS